MNPPYPLQLLITADATCATCACVLVVVVVVVCDSTRSIVLIVDFLLLLMTFPFGYNTLSKVAVIVSRYDGAYCGLLLPRRDSDLFPKKDYTGSTSGSMVIHVLQLLLMLMLMLMLMLILILMLMLMLLLMLVLMMIL